MQPDDEAILTIDARERAILAGYAMHSAASAGRRYPERPHRYRGPFQRDRDRIVHSAAYRRLAHKMQVFTGELGDYHRTRLTHTHEVASVARSLGRALRLNEDLIEALALAHDIGHPPFGHAGEDALDACLQDVGGFNHNRQALRIVEELEHRYPEFPGLNLSREVLDGQATRIEQGATTHSPLLEVQVVETADSVAYNTHDVDDALRLGLLDLDELVEIPLWREAERRVRDAYGPLDGGVLKRAILRELVDWQVGDVLEYTRVCLRESRVSNETDVRAAPWLVSASPEVVAAKQELERLLHQRVYRHPRLLEMRRRAKDMLSALFNWYVEDTLRMPDWYARRCESAGAARTAGDYIAGMTDRFAQRTYHEIVQSSQM